MRAQKSALMFQKCFYFDTLVCVPSPTPFQSPYLQNLIFQHHGQIDERLRGLMFFEKYLRFPPQSARSIIRMGMSAIARAYPVEAEIIRRELKSGEALSPAEIEEIENGTPETEKDFEVQFRPRGDGWGKVRLG